MKISSNRPVQSIATQEVSAKPAPAAQAKLDQSRFTSSFQAGATATAKKSMNDSEVGDFLNSTLSDLRSGTSTSEGGKMIDSILEESKFGATVKDSVAQGIEEWAAENPGASLDEMKDKMTSLALDADLRMQSLERMMKRMKELNPWKE